jgi:hydrocephalus-inducing protein
MDRSLLTLLKQRKNEVTILKGTVQQLVEERNEAIEVATKLYEKINEMKKNEKGKGKGRGKEKDIEKRLEKERREKEKEKKENEKEKERKEKEKEVKEVKEKEEKEKEKEKEKEREKERERKDKERVGGHLQPEAESMLKKEKRDLQNKVLVLENKLQQKDLEINKINAQVTIFMRGMKGLVEDQEGILFESYDKL